MFHRLFMSQQMRLIVRAKLNYIKELFPSNYNTELTLKLE